MSNGKGRHQVPVGIVPDGELGTVEESGGQRLETFRGAAAHDLRERSPSGEETVGLFQRHWRLAIVVALGAALGGYFLLRDTSKAYRPPVPWESNK